jgi:phage-related protein
MPVVLVDLGGFALALLAILCAIAIDVVIRTISKALGKFGIGPFSINLESIVYNFASGAISHMVDDTKQYWDDIAHWFTGHEYILRTFAYNTVQAVQHVGDQIAQIVNHEIPNAISDLRGDVESFVGGVKNGIERDIGDAATAAATALTKADRGIYIAIGGDLDTVASNLKSAVGSALDSAEDYTDTHIKDLHTYVDTQIASTAAAAVAEVQALKTQLGAAITGVAQDAASNLSAAKTAIEGDLSGDITAVRQTITGDVTDLSNKIGDAASTAAAATSALGTKLTGTITSDVTDLTGKIGDVASTDATNLAKEAQSLSGTITSDVSALSDRVTSDAATAAGDLSGVQGQLTTAITAAVGAVALRVTKLEECSVGVCDDSPNNFSHLLQDAIGVADFAEFADFVKGAIQNPGAAVGAFSGAASGLYSDADGLLSSLLSL